MHASVLEFSGVIQQDEHVLLTMVSNTHNWARTPGQETPSPRQTVCASVLAWRQPLKTAVVLLEQRDRQIWKEVLLSHLLAV